MPTNLEIKAKYPSLVQAKKISRTLGARFSGTLNQTDTYFKVKQGRLKLREINEKELELIYYRRANARGSRYSEYTVLELQKKEAAKRVLNSLFETMVIVKKKRVLFLYKNSRIHIDSVAGLGGFIEFEVLVVRGKKQAQQLILFLRRIFGIDSSMLIAGSYSDMLLKQ
ncbi:MAG: class IV adenylate cyclase [Ignavibacteriales bacterium]|nr:class IV adenylate cyclase [Ignavibacteriales bacterium]